MLSKSIRLVACVLPLTGTGCIVIGVGGWSPWHGPTVWTEAATSRMLIDTADLREMEVRTHNGSITFAGRPAGTGEAYVEVTKQAGGSTWDDAERALGAIDVYAEAVGGGTLRIGWRWTSEKQPAWGARVSFDIHAPGELSFDGKTHNGGLDIQGVTGTVRTVSHNGPINVESTGGKLSARTHNGRITAEYSGRYITLATHNGHVVADLEGCGVLHGTITTHNGGVEMIVGDGTSAELSCRTHNGRIKCDLPLDAAQFSRRKVTGRIGAGEGALELATHNGSVRIRKSAG